MDHIVIPDDMELYFVSDFHFCHHRLCKGYDDAFDMPRNFDTVDEMNDAIVTSMQNLPKHSAVVFLGDFMMNVPGSKMHDKFFEFFKEFACERFYYIFGNHDHELKKKLRNEPITFYPYAIFEHRGKTYFCQHRDFIENPYFLKHEYGEDVPHKNFYLVHGHTHSPILRSKVGFMTQNCVCFDVACRPLKADELFASNEEEVEVTLDAEVAKYYEDLAAERGMAIDQLIEDTLHHTMESSKDVLKENEEAFKHFPPK